MDATCSSYGNTQIEALAVYTSLGLASSILLLQRTAHAVFARTPPSALNRPPRPRLRCFAFGSVGVKQTFVKLAIDPIDFRLGDIRKLPGIGILDLRSGFAQNGLEGRLHRGPHTT